MVVFTTDFLKNSSALIVAGFITSGTPLSEGVASVAIANSLNSDQIKRLVEVTNQVAYLKLLSSTQDRTFEFKLADYPEVINLMTSPTIAAEPVIEKVASVKTSVSSPWDIFEEESTLEKVAEEEQIELSFSDSMLLLNKHEYSLKRDLEKVAEQEALLVYDLTMAPGIYRKDEELLSKVASVVEGDEEMVSKVSVLMYKEARAYDADAKYYEEDLEEAKALVGLLKVAYETRQKRESIEADLRKIATAKDSFTDIKRKIKSGADAGVSVGKRVGAGLGNAALGLAKIPMRGAQVAEHAFFIGDFKPRKNVWTSLQK